MDKNLKKKKKKALSVYDFDIPVTVKQDDDHETWYTLLDPKQGYNHSKFERPLKIVRQKANVKVLVQAENTSIISNEYVQKWKIVVYSLSTWLTSESDKVST